MAEFSPDLLFFFDLLAVLGVTVNDEDKLVAEDVSGNIVLGVVAASVAMESKLLHLVIMHNRNSLCKWTKIYSSLIKNVLLKLKTT